MGDGLPLGGESALTFSSYLREQLRVARLAVRLALLLDVRGARQRVHAERTRKALRVPLLV